MEYLRIWKKHLKKDRDRMKFDYAYIQFGHL